MISHCSWLRLDNSKPEVESLSIFWFNTVLINILFHFRIIKHRVKKYKSKRTNTKKVINKSYTNSSACYKEANTDIFLCLHQHVEAEKAKCKAVFDVLLYLKQHCVVLNMNALHITCIFIKPSQALLAWKMFLSTYDFTRCLWSAVANRNTGMNSVILMRCDKQEKLHKNYY